ncbi:internalin-related protein [Bifidobacterium dolichotidis]|uniref:Internalin-related protein n=1 Tax=Bifidobacterium dolichotidis TaxID=2306976 RepID=A0A430FRX5_9BIFI|nr:S-layer homology domain-containing protein [Bifidobacterium dolichotidis]RSX55636.1 internalin-related protein [Bifidobacterium dolichotidis]
MKGSVKNVVIAATAALSMTCIPFLTGTAIAEVPTGDIEINETNFPDEVFRNYVEKEWDTEGDGILTQEERESVTELRYVSEEEGYQLTSLKGIEFFPEVRNLYLMGNNLQDNIDISQNQKLVFVNVSDNAITSLDVSKNANVMALIASENQISSLDTSQCPQLTMIDARSNALSSFDATGNPVLQNLNLSMNQLSSLDIASNAQLQNLSIDSNQLSGLDISRNPDLYSLSASDNNLSAIDTSQNPELETMNVSENRISSIDISKNTHLHSLYATVNQLESINFGDIQSLSDVIVDYNPLPTVDVSQLVILSNFAVRSTGLTSLDVSHNPELQSLDISNTKISSIDVSHNQRLTELSADGLGLTSINVSHNPGLTELSVSGNELTSLDTTQNPNLAELDITDNNLTSLFLPQKHEDSSGVARGLKKLTVAKNPLLYLDLAGIPGEIHRGDLADPDAAYYTSEKQLDFRDVAPLMIMDSVVGVRGGRIVGNTLVPDSYPSTVTYQYISNGTTWDARVMFTDQPRYSFKDVNTTTPHHEDIQWVSEHKIAHGFVDTDGSSRFEPMWHVNRQDMAAFLRRIAVNIGITAADAWHPAAEDWLLFTDVHEWTPHAEDILWLAKFEIATGYEGPDGTRYFAPEVKVYRQDMAAFLHRLVQLTGDDTPVEAKAFTDVTDATPHAEHIRWLGGAGIAEGYKNADDTWRYEPMTTVYRQDMAAFLHRLDTFVKK